MPLEKPFFALDPGVSLDDYVKLRRKLGYGCTAWKIIYQDKSVAYWGTNFLELWIYVFYQKPWWRVGVKNRRGATREIMVEATKSLAMKGVRILQDFLPTTSVDEIDRRWDALNILIEGKERKRHPRLSGGKQTLIPHGEIKRVYVAVCAVVKRKYGITPCPPLRILRRMHSFDARYLTMDGRSAIQIIDFARKCALRDTIQHELAHFVAHHKYGPPNQLTHGIPFLEIYKDLSGRDYFKRQEEAVNELAEREKAERGNRELEESQAKTEERHTAEGGIARSVKPPGRIPMHKPLLGLKRH